MPRPKRRSPAVANAQKRCAALKSIDPVLDLGGGLTCAAFDAAIQAALDRLGAYSTALPQMDAALNELQAAEKSLAGLSERKWRTPRAPVARP